LFPLITAVEEKLSSTRLMPACKCSSWTATSWGQIRAYRHS
jgi:hypothetical protein